ncbi:hypothetical protein CYQ75_12465 [Enterococcus faecium]|nr:hypothetical protein CYQ75_12465 [Enterococcus faecium]
MFFPSILKKFYFCSITNKKKEKNRISDGKRYLTNVNIISKIPLEVKSIILCKILYNVLPVSH